MTEVLRYAAFTTDPAGGNPAGVVLDSRGLDDPGMQRIAAEVGYSETAFLSPLDPAARHYRLRYFSPPAEIAFCGHATIATAVALAERDGTGEVVFETAAGPIPVRTERERTIVATLTSAPARSRPAPGPELARLLSALRWSRADLDPEWPVHVAFAGNDHPVLAARSRERLAGLDYDFDALKSLMLEHGWATVALFWPQDQHTVHARNPFPVGGVVEDPATGAAAAAFGGYLRALGRVTRPERITILQGADMGRPSEIIVRVGPDDPRVRVTGAAGTIPLPVKESGYSAGMASGA